MPLQLFDSATGSLREFVPIRSGHVGVYLCGPTVQDVPHVGHLRSAIAFDQLRHWLEIGHGLDVTLVRNITDLDDKVLTASAEVGIPWWALAYRNERAFALAYKTLGVGDPTYEPRATGHIAEMLDFISTLMGRGHAYRALDGSGDVYFDVASWSTYGSLTRQRTHLLTAPESSDVAGKRDPRDFALWKAAGTGTSAGSKTDRAVWDSPYGPGRPGWHLSCSTMSLRYLGESFDIHGGGIDLRFPHHENEQAQSQAAGYDFARYWIHNGWVTIGERKISKSLGNAAAADSLLRDVRPLDLRYYLGSAHYRSELDLSSDGLHSAGAGMRRISEFIGRHATADNASHVDVSALPTAFRNAMDDDLNVPMALAVLHAEIRRGNEAALRDTATARDAVRSVLAMSSVLGVNPKDRPWVDAGPGVRPAQSALEQLVVDALDLRAEARHTGDFATADAIRNRLLSAGIAVRDRNGHTTWSLMSELGAQNISTGTDCNAVRGSEPIAPPHDLRTSTRPDVGDQTRTLRC